MTVLVAPSCLDRQPYLVKIFPIWSDAMALEKSGLYGKSAISETEQIRPASGENASNTGFNPSKNLTQIKTDLNQS